MLVSQYGACSDTCLPWQGKVYIDDVFQEYHGPGGGSFGVSRNGRQYMFLSIAIQGGLFHPNCRHTISTWIEGISTMPKPMNVREIERVNKLEAKQRYLEREVRKAKREAAGLTDNAAQKAANARVREKQEALREFIREHKDVLRKDYWRERDTGTQKSRGTQKEHEDWLRSIGAESTSLNTLDKYLSAKYDETDEFGILDGYRRAVENGDISPLVGLTQYKVTAAAIDDYIVGEITSTGVQIEGYVSHFIDRVIGQTADAHSGMRRGVPVTDALDAILNPVLPIRTKMMSDGDIRQTFTGEKAIVTISARDRIVIQTNPR